MYMHKMFISTCCCAITNVTRIVYHHIIVPSCQMVPTGSVQAGLAVGWQDENNYLLVSISANYTMIARSVQVLVWCFPQVEMLNYTPSHATIGCANPLNCQGETDFDDPEMLRKENGPRKIVFDPPPHSQLKKEIMSTQKNTRVSFFVLFLSARIPRSIV